MANIDTDGRLGGKGFQLLIEKVQKDIGFFGAQYKEKCLKRRFNARMRRHNMEDNYWAYIKYLDQYPDEYEKLLKSLTINVTRFFRNLPVFDFLFKKTLSKMIEEKKPGCSLRIWSAGCASGEETYSLAMIALEQKKKWKSDVNISIVGTDIDVDSLRIARAGIYPESALDETPDLFKTKYFEKIGDNYKVVSSLNRLVRFRQQDLFRDSYPRFNDLICCRNVIIYFSKEAQVQLIEKFIQSLARRGYLILGKTETLNAQFSDVFERVNSRERIFRKK
ncbi:MAG: hypothetical protein B6244_01365 [Candidatus Cloacimonetes bacterium 4572_55]|nr:MAG: hypothetical protein B6244_01365 [Candidatus Cloacimonetes bacterium 4572_55]